MHENVRFICDVCDKEFTSCHTLKRHKSVKHTNDAAKFYCSEDGCSYSTHSTYNLRVHVEKVHQGIKWPCDMCDYVGGYKGDLNRHKKIAH